MKTKDIRKKARDLGVANEASLGRTELIRAIQTAEGNPQCFQTGRVECDQTQCAWLEDCIPGQYARQRQAVGVGARTGKWRQ